MAHRVLQRIISIAVTDPEFCDKLLNGRRRTLLAEFDLTDEEHEALMAINAASLQEFAAHLEEWLQTRNGKGDSGDLCGHEIYPAAVMADNLRQSVPDPIYKTGQRS